MSNLHSQTLLPKSNENLRKQDGPKSNCPKTGIHYKPKRSKPPSTTTSAPSDPTRSPSNGRGHLQVYTLNQKRGCIISKGTWFSSGTCATFRINRASGKGSLKANLREKTILTRSLKTRRFHPPIKKGTLCFLQRHLQLQQSRPKPHRVHSKQIPSVHPPISDPLTKALNSLQTIDGKIAYNGNTTFFADKAPKGPTQSKIFASNDEHPIELSIEWQEV